MHPVAPLLLATIALTPIAAAPPDPARIASERGATYAECGKFAAQILRGWLETKQDPKTHLYSRGKTWDYHNEAADHYSSLVLIAKHVEPRQIEPGGDLHETLMAIGRYCSTPSGIPAKFDLRTHAPEAPARLMDLAEWLRDGLTRINEVLGTNTDWYRETVRLTDAILAEASRRGGLHQALETNEGRGNFLQTLTRLYVMSGQTRYLEAAESLADRVLLSGQPFTPDLLQFNDHGCEFVPGLTELFALECQLRRPRAKSYREPVIELLNALMASGAHPVTGLFTNPAPAGKDRPLPPDTWGYVLFAYENFERATGDTRFRERAEKPMRWLLEHRNRYPELSSVLWPRSKSSDDWSDSYESMIVLWNRYRNVGDGFAWLDWATRQHIHRRAQHPSYGPFTGGHFDGSVGRTLSMHMMLCSQGVTALPFAPDLELGGEMEGDRLALVAKTGRAWNGRLRFDGTRNVHVAGMLDWSRLNEMPQWFVVHPKDDYEIAVQGRGASRHAGAELIAGLPLALAAGESRELRIRRVTKNSP